MYVEKIMTREVITVREDTRLPRMSELMEGKRLRHLPVVDAQGAVLGIVSHRDLQKAAPSAITTLDRGEVNYLLDRITAGKIMHRKVVSCSSDTLVEQAGCLMREHRIGCLPVVDSGRLVGIVSAVDLVDFFLDITGSREADSNRIAVHLADEIGNLGRLLDAVNAAGGQIVTVVSPVHPDETGLRIVILRYRAEQPAALADALVAQGYDVTARDLV